MIDDDFPNSQIENDFRTINGETDLMQIAMQKYHTLVKDLNNYERLEYDRFLATGTKTVNRALKSNILKLELADENLGSWKNYAVMNNVQ